MKGLHKQFRIKIENLFKCQSRIYKLKKLKVFIKQNKPILILLAQDKLMI